VFILCFLGVETFFVSESNKLKSEFIEAKDPAPRIEQNVDTASSIESDAIILKDESTISDSIPKSKNLVIGIATKLHSANIAIFVHSLRKQSDADLLLFVEKNPHPRTASILEKNDVIVIYLDLDAISEHVSTHRWRLIHQYLHENQDVYSKILLADIRDTAFQSDPFQFVDETFMYSAKESSLIRNEGWNKGWIESCFGREMVKKIGNNYVVCSGISIGGIKPVLEYLDEMLSILEGPTFSSCERNGVDQGIHNVIIYDRNLPNVELLNLDSGFILNLQGWSKRDSVRNFENIQNDAGTVPIVHQYDRNHDLQNFYISKYVDWDMQKDAEEECKDFQIFKSIDLFNKRCDSTMTGGISIETCCKECRAMSDCQGFAHDGQRCWHKSMGAHCENKIRATGVTSGRKFNIT